MKEYEYILFDLDGTITDPKEGITKSVAYALESFGIKVEDLDSLCKFIGPPLKDSFMKFFSFSEEQAELAIKKYREYFSVDGLFENKVYDGIEEMLINLKRRDKHLIIATSKPDVFAKRILEHFKLIHYFDFVAGSDLEGTRVSKSDVITYAFNIASITNKDAVIMVGDREHDVFGAHANGIECISVLYGYGDRQEHIDANTDYIVETVEELANIL